ncbi:MAG: RnfABCDGE type electron transport complex subunit G [Calditrichia bacterium]
MTNILRLSIILALVTVISSWILAEIYNVTKPAIELQKKAKTQAALKYVMPDADKIEPVEKMIPIKDNKGKVLYEKPVVEYYKAFNANGDLIGYAFKAEGPGYSSIVETMVGIDTTGTIKKIKIVSQKETPGLGALCENSEPFDGKKWSTEQFVGKKAENLKVDKDGGEIVSITGATITARVITNSIKNKLEELFRSLDREKMEKIGG